MNTLTQSTSETPIRLTSLSHGGGCGCKIAPSVLEKILAGSLPALVPPQLLVGLETGDDAAVYQINDEQAIVATTDFFMPIVDDPFDFGAIAATNAISDVYAMGGTPLFALAIVGMPVNKLPLETIRSILDGGQSVCAKAGIPIAGGHTIDSVEPIYGLVAIGLVNPKQVKRNASAHVGDKLILSKGLGIGIYSAAFKKGLLSLKDYANMIASTTQLNTPGASLASDSSVHAITDVTGFGLLGHLLEVCKGSGTAAIIHTKDLPTLPNVMDYLGQGCVTGATARNWASHACYVAQNAHWAETPLKTLLTDPQTSGGLLISCAPEAAERVIASLKAQGFDYACEIGEIVSGTPGVSLR